MNERAYAFVAIKGMCVAISVLADWFEYDDREKWRKGTVQALKFLRDAEKTLEELLTELESEGVASKKN